MSTQMLDAYLSLSNIGREMSADSGDLHEVYFLFQIISVQIPVVRVTVQCLNTALDRYLDR